MLYKNIIKNRKVYVVWTHGHVRLKQCVSLCLLSKTEGLFQAFYCFSSVP